MTEKFEQSLKRLQVPCIVINTLKKLKTVLPPLKPPVEKFLKSKVVYKISCSRCDVCYVRQTTRHLITCFKEHKRSGPMGAHMRSCNEILTTENVNIIAKTNRSANHLLTLEALNIKAIKPNLNTEDEYRSRKLTTMFLSTSLLIVYHFKFSQPQETREKT